MAFDEEEANLEIVAEAMVRDAHPPEGIGDRLPRQRAEFAAHIAQFAALRWPLEFRRRLLEAAVEDARDGGWRELTASTLKALGDVERREARLSQARSRYQEALPIFREIQNRLGEAYTLQALGDLERREDRLTQARSCYQEALPIYREIQNRLGEARLSQARSRYEEALLIFREIQARLGEANTLWALGDLEMREDRLTQARSRYEEALLIFREIQDRLGEANTLRALGDLEMLEDRLTQARSRHGEALPIYREIQDRLGEANTLWALGNLEMREDRLTQARSRYEEALPIYREIQARPGVANTVQAMAVLDSLDGRGDRAVEGFQDALRLHREIGNSLGVRAGWVYLGQHYMRNGQPAEAVLAFEESLSALPRQGDPPGYVTTLKAQHNAFARLSNVTGMLSCLRILADIGAGLEERYTRLLDAIKEQSPNADLASIKAALSADPDAVRRTAVAAVRESLGKDTAEQ